MSSVATIRTALQTTIRNYLPTGTAQVYDTIPGIANYPAIVVQPGKANFEAAMGRGLDEWHFNVMIFCSRADERLAQQQLDQFITGAGTESIRQAIFQTPTLGLSDTTAVVESMRGYGGTTKSAGMSVVGAMLVVCVYTDGRS